MCVEKIAGHTPSPVDYGNIPGCTYTTPEVGIVRYDRGGCKTAGIETKTGKFDVYGIGKASAAGAREGFVKLVFNAVDDRKFW